MHKESDICMVNLFLTMHCNKSCNFCASHSAPHRSETMSLSLLQRIARELRNWPEDLGIEYPDIRLTGGEPFLYPYLDDVFSVFDFSPKIEITTNGTAITEQHLDKMCGKNIALNLSVYLDASGQKIVAASKLQRVLASGVPTVCVLVAHSQNQAGLPYVFDQLEQMGAKLIVVIGVKPRRDHADQSIEGLLLQHSEVRNLHHMIENRKHSGVEYVFKEPSTCKRFGAANTAVPGCICATGHLSVRTDGRVTPCNSLLDIDVGSCNDHSLFDLYNAPVMHFVRSMSSLCINDLDPCFSCENNLTCNAGNRVNAFLRNGDWLAVDPHAPCNGRVSRLAFVDPMLTALHHEL